MKFLPFTARFKFGDVLTWEIVASDMTIGEALANEAKKLMAQEHGELVFVSLVELEDEDKLDADIYLEEGDGYMIEGDPEQNVYHDQYIVVVLAEKGEGATG